MDCKGVVPFYEYIENLDTKPPHVCIVQKYIKGQTSFTSDLPQTILKTNVKSQVCMHKIMKKPTNLWSLVLKSKSLCL